MDDVNMRKGKLTLRRLSTLTENGIFAKETDFVGWGGHCLWVSLL